MAETLQRIPPQNIEAEQSVLGATLLDRDAIARALEIVAPDDFYRQAHRVIFEAVGALFEKSEPVDIVTLTEELQRTGLLEGVGGAAYVAELASSVPTAANVEYYARIVAEKATLRRLAGAAKTIAEMVYDGKGDTDDVLDQAQQLVFGIAEGFKPQRYSRLKDVLVETWDHIERLYLNQGGTIGVPTGVPDLDALTSGFQPSELIVLAARPSMGKTTLSLNIAANAAIKHGIPAAIFSLEMSKEQLAQRLLCSEAEVNSHRLRNPTYLSDDDWPRLSRALGRLSEAPIFIDDTPNISAIELRARSRRLKAEHNIGLVVIDYLQLMHTRGRAENRQQEISEITRSLKALARELKVPVLALSQLSRAVEQRTDRKPQLSDLRESGAIEQDADVVAFIYQNPQAQHKTEVELIVAKHRNGPTDTLEILFFREFGRFRSPEKKRAVTGPAPGET